MPVTPEQAFGRLTVLSSAGRDGAHLLWLCQCICGKQITTRQYNLLHNKTQSCGCLRKDCHVKKHGGAGRHRTSEYRAWQSMRTRCLNSKDKAYPNYGGRGITICDRWGKFENFIADMGKRPSPDYSLDRKNVYGVYEPANCRWATRSEQMKNCRSKKAIENFSNAVLLSELQRRMINGSITST